MSKETMRECREASARDAAAWDAYYSKEVDNE